MTVIIAGPVHVAPADRDRFVRGHQRIVEEARRHPGCLDVSISPDPVEPGRVNIFEYWESEEVLAEWRASAPPPSVRLPFEGGGVRKHVIARTGGPFD
ncbi:quinol monooxygenase YgiN [Amycolatopsis lexingtonensis]|uniref:Quinol monooxygenase YgiN n=1 Tax=Amycolatopsis lexingtonensis TaxID=218822 RepID=A0ABR9HPY8_9PSEU|nr:antibiotic biosynthesis monooxygenase family protein [Amycolatopsis lexingtonensis]MBE1493000.1 quinol monooxygenase YgiN [Amycolatopsis lexingtonensis]